MLPFEVRGAEKERRKTAQVTVARRVGIILLVGAVVGLGLTYQQGSTNPEVETKTKLRASGSGNVRPNIIHIFMDDVGLNDLGYTGAPYKTPTMDELARTGMVLDGHRVFPSCTPTRMAFLTGRLPYEFGVTHAGYMTAYHLPSEKVLPEVLNAAGYKSFGFGKWHAGRASESMEPNARGFETWIGFTEGMITQTNLVNEMPWAFFVMDGGITPEEIYQYDAIEDAFGLYAWEVNGNITELPDNGNIWGDDLSTDGAIEAIQKNCTADVGQPCFVYLNFGSPHAPIVRPPQIRGTPEFSRCANISRTKRRVYCQMMQKIDTNIKRIVSELKASGKWMDTMIVITSDNGALPDIADGNEPFLWDGYGSSLPYRGTKITPFEGGIKTEAIVTGGYALKQYCLRTIGATAAACGSASSLKSVMANHRNQFGEIRKDGMVSVQDWFSTYAAIAEAAPSDIPTQVEGIDMSDMLFAGMPSNRTVYSAIGGENLNLVGELTTSCVIMNGFKMVWNPVVSPFMNKAIAMGWRQNATLDGYWDVDVEPTKVTPGGGEGNPIMMFDLINDPTEMVDLYNDPAYAGRQQELTAKMAELRTLYTKNHFPNEPAGLYAGVEEGYVIYPWDPEYSFYNGTVKDALDYWVQLRNSSTGGEDVVRRIRKLALELRRTSEARMRYSSRRLMRSMEKST